MADNIPSIPGGVPPKPEQSKVQPKKETVRINLPPKPSAAPTIKLPTLPPGGPTAAPGAPAFSPPPAPSSAPAPRPATAAPVSAVPQPRAQQRPAPVPVAAVSGLDKALAIVAAVAAVAAVGTTVWMMMILQQALEK